MNAAPLFGERAIPGAGVTDRLFDRQVAEQKLEAAAQKNALTSVDRSAPTKAMPRIDTDESPPRRPVYAAVSNNAERMVRDNPIASGTFPIVE